MAAAPRKKRVRRPPPRHPRLARFREICQVIWLFVGLPEFWPLFPRKGKAKKPPTETAITGAWGEDIAGDFLRRAGYRILDRNVRFGPEREIDIVARAPRRAGEPPVLVFVEVKTRSDETRGRPFAAVDDAKRRTLARAAALYVRKLRERPAYVRFDVVEVVGHPKLPTAPVVRHIENAFTLPGNGRLPV